MPVRWAGARVAVRAGEQAPGRLSPRGRGEVAGLDPVRDEAVVGHAGPEGLETPPTVHHLRSTGDVADGLVPQLDQVRDRRPDAGRVVLADRGQG